MAARLRPLAALAAVAAAVLAAEAQAAPSTEDVLWRDAFPSHLDSEVPQAASGVVPGSTTPSGVQVMATTRDQASVLAKQPPLPLLPAQQQIAGDVQIKVDPSQRFQPIVGLGAALTESSAYAIFRAPPDAQEALLQRLFGPPEKGGAKLSVLRLTVGVSDFSVSYGPQDLTYDETADDYNLDHFSTAKDDAFLLPMIRRILAINPDLIIMASPWTAPLWLKNSSDIPGKGWLRDQPEVFNTYSEYLVRYLEEYNSKGVRIHYLTLQNEPGHGNCGPMPCMLMSPEHQIRLAQLVGQRLRASTNPNVSATKLLAYDFNWGPDDELPQTKDWNDWLMVLLLAPVPVLFALCGIVSFLLWRIGYPVARIVMGDESDEEQEDDAEEEEDTYDPKFGVVEHGFAHGGGTRSLGVVGVEHGFVHGGREESQSDPEVSGSDSESESRHGRSRRLCSSIGFGHGVCAGGLIMFLVAWANVLFMGHLVRSGAVEDKIPVDDLSRTFNGPNWPAAVLMSPAGPEFVGVAWHCYGGDPSVQSKLHDRIAPLRQQPLEQHMTECSGGDWSGPWEGSLVWNQKVLIMQNFHNHGRSVFQWNLALDENHGPHCDGGACCTNCRGVVTVPSKAESIEDIVYNVEFVGLAHHTSALRPGAQRIFSEVSKGDKVHAVAYRNADGSSVLVVVNEDASANATIQVSAVGNSFRYTLAPGVATFKW